MTGPRSTTPKVLAALATAETWVAPRWIAETIGLRVDQVESALQRLVKEGKVLKAGSRQARSYRLADAAPAAADPPADDAAGDESLKPTVDVAFWASGGIVIEKDGTSLALDAAEADRLLEILNAGQSLRDEFVDMERAAAAAVAEDAAA